MFRQSPSPRSPAGVGVDSPGRWNKVFLVISTSAWMIYASRVFSVIRLSGNLTPSPVAPVSPCFCRPSAPLPSVHRGFIVDYYLPIRSTPVLLSIYIHGCHTAQLSYLPVIMYAQIKGCKTGVYLHMTLLQLYIVVWCRPAHTVGPNVIDTEQG